MLAGRQIGRENNPYVIRSVPFNSGFDANPFPLLLPIFRQE